MLNNIPNFFNLVKGKRVKKTLAPNDMIAIGVRNPVNRSDYQPAGIYFKDLEDQLNSGTSLTLTTLGTSGAATLTGNTLNIPNYTTSVLPAWLESNSTDLTIWNNGKSNIATNTSYGDGSLKSNTTGSANTSIGYRAGFSNTTGPGNTFIGSQTGFNNTTGPANTFVGRSAGSSNTAGGSNAFFGDFAGGSNITGNWNVFVGAFAGQTNTIGSANTVVGRSASTANFSGSVVLGYQAAATADNQFVVGSSSVNAGTITAEVITPDNTWLVRINGVNYKIPLLLIP